MGDSLHVAPSRVGIIHFIGIGGIGMSGIAAILKDLGYQVRGSDIAESTNVIRLRDDGIDVTVGHDAMNVQGAAVVVVSSDIKSENVELQAARSAGIPVVKRAEMLAELMRLKPSVAIAGSHGKTTTTSILAHVMDTCQMDPTVVCGGIIEALGTNARLGSGEWVVAEADESDGSFNKLPATLKIVTSIDPEHMTYYKDFDTLLKAFDTFTENVPFYGLNILCFDHPEVRKLAQRTHDRRVLTYGFDEGADVRGVNMRYTSEGITFDLELNGRATSLNDGYDHIYSDIHLPMFGQHNLQNALSVICVALELGLSMDDVSFALRTFKGVRRRFTEVGVVGGVRIIDDYAHHPIEIQRAIEGAKQSCQGRVHAVVQPHRFSRLKDLFDDFSTSMTLADASYVVPVHAAGEAPIVGCDHTSLVQLAQKNGNPNVQAVDDFSSLVSVLSDQIESGDLVICMGAGSITKWAADLVEALPEHTGFPEDDKAMSAMVE